jgi:hypothetical protein
MKAVVTEKLSSAINRQTQQTHQDLKVLLLSSSLLTDRMFLHSDFLRVLSEGAQVKIWATSAKNPRFYDLWGRSNAQIEEFPKVAPFKGFPYNLLRRLNNSMWDFRFDRPSRQSMWKHVRSKDKSIYVTSTLIPARLLALIKAEKLVEDKLERILLRYPRSPESIKRLQAEKPAFILTTGPFQFEQPGVIAAAKKLGIPTIAFIPSWDNISTKDRLVFKYDGYIVWSEQTKRELYQFYPDARQVPVYVVGAPQFDTFFNKRYYLSRQEFCERYGLRPDLPIIVHALGSPNFLQEHDGALFLAKQVATGKLGDVQLIVRPHPIHDNREMTELFNEFAPRVILQHTAEAGTALTARSQDENQIIDWVNTFRHADVVVNLSSTVTIDAAIFDRPIVNINYDSEPGQPNQELIKDVNHRWTHFKPIAESGGVWLVNNEDELLEAIRAYLVQPDLHKEKRRWIAEYVCQYLDGRSGTRMAQALLDFAHNARRLCSCK